MPDETGEEGLSAILKRAITDSGMSLNALAKAAGVNNSVLSRFMRDERSLTIESAEKLIAYLGIKVSGPESPDQPPAKKGKK